jgi:predicted NBD/HSP70 family sugar kinase
MTRVETKPRAKDPIALAGITVQAVDQIGEAAAAEIEQAAESLERAAQEIGAKLRALSAAMRDHSKVAGGHVEEFCGKATALVEGVRAWQERLDGISEKGNGKEVPAPASPSTMAGAG